MEKVRQKRRSQRTHRGDHMYVCSSERRGGVEMAESTTLLTQAIHFSRMPCFITVDEIIRISQIHKLKTPSKLKYARRGG